MLLLLVGKPGMETLAAGDHRNVPEPAGGENLQGQLLEARGLNLPLTQNAHRGRQDPVLEGGVAGSCGGGNFAGRGRQRGTHSFTVHLLIGIVGRAVVADRAVPREFNYYFRFLSFPLW